MTELPTTWRWLDPADCPPGHRVLDLTVLAAGLRARPSDPALIDRFTTLRSDDGNDLPATPIRDGLDHAADLRFPPPDTLEDGAVFRATRLEDKWDLFVLDSVLYARRSWTGELVFRAALGFDGDDLVISSVHAAPDDPSPVAQLDFLVWTHFLGRPVPHPVPKGMLDDADATARWSFSAWGRRGLWATDADTITFARAEVDPVR